MKLGDAGVNLIKEFEGFPHNGRPYQDMVKVWTIGYGHTHGVGPATPPITEPQACELLRRDVDQEYSPAVDGLHLDLDQHQFDALVSFVFNCGPGAISPQTHIGRALRAGQWQTAADCLLEWNKAGGRPVDGLTRRRKAERAMFLEADDPMEGFPKSQREQMREYDRLLRRQENPARRAELQAEMIATRKQIWRKAQPREKGGDGRGWEANNRRARFLALKARTT